MTMPTMPTRTAPEADLVPAPDADRTSYDRDFYSWSLEQARLVRDGLWSAVDRENVAEEIESLGREQFNKLESALRVLILHMLKWDHQSEKRSRSWALSIEAQRAELEDVLADNPGLKPRIPEAVGRAYRKGRIEAAKETGLEKAAFPEQCPYSWDDIVSREFAFR
jgi:predicted DNA-binding ribbon-helix-helix protein